MRSSSLALWFGAVVLAVAASTAAVRLATDQVTTPPVVVTSPAATPSPETTADPIAEPTPTSTPTPSATAATPTDKQSSPADAPSPLPTPTDRSTPTPSPTTSPSARPTPTPTPSATASPDDVPDDSSEAPSDAAPVERTATSTGGTARFRFADGRVTLVWSSPAQGFRVDVENDNDSVRVTFVSDRHESRIDADIEDGQPRIRVREDAHD